MRKPPQRKEGSGHDISDPTDAALRCPLDDRGAGRRVRRTQRHHQSGAGGHYDLWCLHWSPLCKHDAGVCPVPRRLRRKKLADPPGAGAAGHAGRRSDGRGVLPPFVLCFGEPEGGPNHRRHRAEPDGPGPGAIPDPHHCQSEYLGHGRG